MIILSIEFMSDIFKIDNKQGMKICRKIIKMYRNDEMQIN